MEYLREHGDDIRMEATIVSVYPHADDADVRNIQLKDRHKFRTITDWEEAWLENLEWAVSSFNQQLFNVAIEYVGSPDDYVVGFYHALQLMRIELKKRSITKLSDLEPKNTILYYLAYLMSVLRGYAGVAGTRHGQAYREFIIDPPYGTYYDPSGITYLLHQEAMDLASEPGILIDQIFHVPTELGETLLMHKIAYELILSYNEETRVGYKELVATYSDRTRSEQERSRAHQMMTVRLKEVLETRQYLLLRAMNTSVYVPDQRRHELTKYYEGMRHVLEASPQLNYMDYPNQILDGSILLMYKTIPRTGDASTERGFRNMIISMTGVPQDVTSQDDRDYLEEECENLQYLFTKVVQIIAGDEPLPVDPNEEIGDLTEAIMDENNAISQDGGITIEVRQARIAIFQQASSVKYTETWCASIVYAILEVRKIFEKIRREGGRRNAGLQYVRERDVTEDSPMLDMSEEVANSLTHLFSFLSNKNKMLSLSRMLNIHCSDLNRTKKKTAIDVLNRILNCYAAKYHDIFVEGDVALYRLQEEVVDEAADEFINEGFGVDGDQSRDQLPVESQEYLDQHDMERDRRSAMTTRNTTRIWTEREEVQEDNILQQEYLNRRD